MIKYHFHIFLLLYYRYEDVRSTPSWAAKDLEAELELGKTKITFYATSPYSREVASCSFTIHIRDIIPPRVYNCPTDFNVYLKDTEKEKEVRLIMGVIMHSIFFV